MSTTDYLMNIRQITKLHENMLKKICVKYDLSLIEANIISFLYNNPGKDTAGDIVELRMLSKGNVSQGVEMLAGKGFLLRSQDKEDRRKVHLRLSDAVHWRHLLKLPGHRKTRKRRQRLFLTAFWKNRSFRK